MNYFFFIFKSAYHDLMRNKIRTFLTTLGIVIGVLSVIILIALGLGLKQSISDQFDSLGTNLVYILPGQVFNNSGGFRASFSGSVAFDEKDLYELKKIDVAKTVIPGYQKTGKIEALGKAEFATLYGTSEEVFEARNLELDSGELFDKNSVNKKEKVVVMGPKIAEKIFGDIQSAVNQKIRIDNLSFQVIGVLKAKGGGGFGGPNFDEFVYIPYKTAFIISNSKTFTAFTLKSVSTEEVENLKLIAKEMMLKNYEEDDFTVADSKEILTTIQSIFTILNSVLVAIGAVSLIVGGIGIMNIMYVSVTERIREIGIRRAMGALAKDILFQFLAEAVLLSMLGGLIGIALSFILVFVISFFFPAYIDLFSMGMAIVVSSSIGIFFGVFPANAAAKLSPIEAIRYE